MVKPKSLPLQPSQPERLGEHHELGTFDCGNDTLNGWLMKRARKNEREGASRTYVVCVNGKLVVAYYCLATGSVDLAKVRGRIRRNMPDPIPAMILGRLAVDRHWQGRNLGSALLFDAVKRTMIASEIAGIRAIVVHAISEEAKRFYEERGFEASPVATMTMMVTLKDAVANLE